MDIIQGYQACLWDSLPQATKGVNLFWYLHGRENVWRRQAHSGFAVHAYRQYPFRLHAFFLPRKNASQLQGYPDYHLYPPQEQNLPALQAVCIP